MNTEKPIEIFKYRDLEIPIYLDDAGQQYFCYLDDEEVDFGSFNTDYKNDLKYLIDKKLDTICRFPDYPGAELEYFFNGINSYRDIRLLYKTRIIKVYLLKDSNEIQEISMDWIKKDAENILKILKKSDTQNV